LLNPGEPLRPVDPLVFTVTRLDLFNDMIQGFATGFFYLRDDRLYLVTNRHVLVTPDTRPLWKTASAELHTSPNVYDHQTFELPLFRADGSPNWMLAPPPADIAVLPLDRSRFTSAAHITWLTPDSIFPLDFVLDIGADAFLIGYPESFRDEPANLPVFRKAMVASIYGVSFGGRPCFLTDGQFHVGMSGGPVIVQPRDTWRGIRNEVRRPPAETHYLLGVHSGEVELEVAREGDDQTSTLTVGLGWAWYPDAINRAIDQ